MLTRQSEVAADNKKGRKKHADVQMKLFDDLFHDELSEPLHVTPTKLYDVQLSYTEPQAQDAALDTQREILKQLRADTPDLASSDENPDNFVEKAVLHNLEQDKAFREWVDLEDALRGPAHVAKVLIQRSQAKRSKPNRPYKLNAEQLECVALYVKQLEYGFARRPDTSKPSIHPAQVLSLIHI